MLSVFLFAVAFCIVRTIPETAPYAETLESPGGRAVGRKPAAVEAQHSWGNFRQSAAKYPQLVIFLGCKAAITLAYMLLESTFALYTSQRFDLSPKTNGCVSLSMTLHH